MGTHLPCKILLESPVVSGINEGALNIYFGDCVLAFVTFVAIVGSLLSIVLMSL